MNTNKTIAERMQETMERIGEPILAELDHAEASIKSATNPFNACIASGYAKGIYFALVECGKIEGRNYDAAVDVIEKMLLKKMSDSFDINPDKPDDPVGVRH